MRVTYRYVRPRPALYVRAYGPYAQSAAEAWAAMNGWLDECQARAKCRSGYGIYRDDPATTPAELRRYDACIPLIPELDHDAPEQIGRQVLPGGAYAFCTHVGSYHAIGDMFSQMRRSMVAARGLKVDGHRPFLAIYLNDPLVTREAHLRTDICVPVVPIQVPLATNDIGDAQAFSARTA